MEKERMSDDVARNLEDGANTSGEAPPSIGPTGCSAFALFVPVFALRSVLLSATSLSPLPFPEPRMLPDIAALVPLTTPAPDLLSRSATVAGGRRNVDDDDEEEEEEEERESTGGGA